MKFKVALSITSDEKPYLVQLAIPDGRGKFLVYECRFKRAYDAVIMANDYFHAFDSDPASIMEFHKERTTEYERILTLPFTF